MMSCLFDPASIDDLEQLMKNKFFDGETGKIVERTKFRSRMSNSIEQNYEALQQFDIKNVAKLTEEIYFGK